MKTKAQLIENLFRFINQRPGFEFGNYGDLSSYRADSRRATKQRQNAIELLNYVARNQFIGLQELLEAMPERNRLSVNPESLSVTYTAGQYFPTEYRGAVCSSLVSLLWDFARTECNCESREKIQAFARRNFSRQVAKLFN